MNTQDSSFPRFCLIHPRLAGAIYTAVGSLIFYIFSIIPLNQALNHAPEISTFSVKLSVCGIIVAAAGLLLFLGGEYVYRFFDTKSNGSKLPVTILSVVIAAGALAITLSVKSRIESLGYTFH